MAKQRSYDAQFKLQAARLVGELRLLGKPRRMNEFCFCAALNCRF